MPRFGPLDGAELEGQQGSGGGGLAPALLPPRVSGQGWGWPRSWELQCGGLVTLGLRMVRRRLNSYGQTQIAKHSIDLNESRG